MRKAIKLGLLRVNSNLKYVILFWGINTVFAILLTGPIFLFLRESLQHSVQAEKLIEGFDYLWFLELNYVFSEIIKALPTILVMAGIIFLLVQVFLSGGIYQILSGEARKNLFIDFFYGCVRYFYRFFKIFLISVICYIGLYFVNIIYLNYIDILSINSESEFLIILFNLLRYFTIIILFGTLNLIFDYVRIRIVIYQNYNVLKDLWLSFKLIVKKFWRVSILFWFFVSFGFLIFIIHTQLDNYFNPTNYIYIFIIFIMHQIYIITKIWIKIFFISSQMEFYRHLMLSSAKAIKLVQIEMPLQGEK
jgi:hypothetical protein